jgi:hypothetical protein
LANCEIGLWQDTNKEGADSERRRQDKGGKKDKDKGQKQKVAKKEQAEKKQQSKQPKKTP